MPLGTAVAAAHPNIAFIKYWGDRDPTLRIPANGSISLTLDGLTTETRVRFDSQIDHDQLVINGRPADPAALARVSQHLDLVRELAGVEASAAVESTANFPTAAGLASSAAAFAALSLAASAAAGLDLDEAELSALARRGSGSAARSIFGGFVELVAGDDHQSSRARQVAGPEHWPIVDLIVVTDPAPKAVGSTFGHSTAPTSPLQAARVADAPRRVEICRQAILVKDFTKLAEIVELDSDMMHAVMMTSSPPQHYWRPATLAVMAQVRSLRGQGLAACYTLDAGPNVHCLCPESSEADLREGLADLGLDYQILRGTPGGGARLVARS